MLFEFYKGKKIFITGHTGFKGSWLVNTLLEAGAIICGYSLTPNTKPSLFELLNLQEKIENHFGDIRDYEHLKQVMMSFNPELVFHLAAQPIVRQSYEDPIATYDINVMGTVHLLDAVRFCSNVKSVINVTTDKVYRNHEVNRGYKEEDELCGFDPYSNSKSCSELVTDSYIKSFLHAKGIAVSTLRAGNVIGGGDYSADRIIPDCVRATLEGRSIEVRNPNSIRPYQHVLEPIFIYMFVAMKQYQNSSLASAYNIGPSANDNLSTGELADIFCDVWGGNSNWDSVVKNGPHEANLLMLDCTKIGKIFNWSPMYNAKQAIEKTVELYKAFAISKSGTDVIQHQILQYRDQFDTRMHHE